MDLGAIDLLEKELKYGLDKRTYSKLLRAFLHNRQRVEKLINYYFDDSHLQLRKKRYALRIRKVNKNKYFLTLKYPAKTPKASPYALKVRVEHEFPIAPSIARALLAGEKSITDVKLEPVRILRKKFPKAVLLDLRPLGVINTKRTVIPLNEKLNLEVDCWSMFRKSFYELEIETQNPKKADQAVRILFDVYDIPYHPLTRSKFSRFIAEWKKSKKRRSV